MHFKSDLFPPAKEAGIRSDNIGFHVFFPAYIAHITIPICAACEEKISELGHSNHVIYVIHYIHPGVDKNLRMAPAVKLHVSHGALYSSS